MKQTHKKAQFEYDILDRFETGIVLTGPEVKSLAGGHASLEGAFVRITDGQAYLVNAHIYPYPFARNDRYEPRRTRTLLLHKKQILAISQKMESKHLTLVPLSWYTTGHKLKLEIALARGKKQYEKRDKIKKEDLKRELEREFRGKVK